MSAAATDPLDATLAAEHAAVHVYGALAARVSVSAEPALAASLREAFAVHRTRRDELTAAIRAAGAEPVAAAPAYAVPEVTSAAAIRRAAAQVETACSAAYAAQVAATSGEWRAWAITALADAALRSVGFGAAETPFPGAPELA